MYIPHNHGYTTAQRFPYSFIVQLLALECIRWYAWRPVLVTHSRTQQLEPVEAGWSWRRFGCSERDDSHTITEELK
ncbi:hypothetical protein SRHO_G00294330 [Serrasalmus rhombeus]